MRRTLFIIAAVVAAVLPPLAQAKGHEEIRVSGLPKHAQPNHGIDVRLALLIEHGQPWDITGISPEVRIMNTKTEETKEFWAESTSKTGVFRVRVRFPGSGTYAVTAWTDANEPRFPHKTFRVRVSGGSGHAAVAIAGSAGAAALACAVGIAAYRRRYSRRRDAAAMRAGSAPRPAPGGMRR